MFKCEHYGIKELVSPIVHMVWQDKAWMFFDESVLKELDLIRERFAGPIVINNWANGGNLKQCGLRSNKDDIVKNKKTLYLSAHMMGKGFDLHAGNGNHRKLFELCEQMIKNKELKQFKRLENFNNTLTWVHIDTFDNGQIIF